MWPFPYMSPSNPSFLLTCLSNSILEKCILSNSPYQAQYSKNFGLLKCKYQKLVPRDISFSETRNFVLLANQQPRSYLKEIYCFLNALAFYELNNQKSLQNFDFQDYQVFATLLNYPTVQSIFSLKREIFRNNAVNYRWTHEEDMLLQHLIYSHQKIYGGNSSLPWLDIARNFNNYMNKSQFRRPAHLQERWRNTLKLNFKRGEWKKAEDLNILFFVKRQGTKWSRLAKLFPDRTEHNLKNRFFSVLSDCLDMPIRRLKQQKEYLKEGVLQQALDHLMKTE